MNFLSCSRAGAGWCVVACGRRLCALVSARAPLGRFEERAAGSPRTLSATPLDGPSRKHTRAQAHSNDLSDAEDMHAQKPPFAGADDAAAAAAADATAACLQLQPRVGLGVVGAHSQHHKQQPSCHATSSAQRCCTDGLHVIFSFLSLSELGVASRCCRRWSDAASTLPPRGDRLSVRTREELRTVAYSPRARHIGRIDLLGLASSPGTLSSLHRLLRLCLRLSNATSIRLGIHMSQQWRDADATVNELAPMRLPNTMREVELRFYSNGPSRYVDWRRVESVVSRLCHHDTMPITALRLHMDAAVEQQMPAATLRHLLFLKESLVEFEIVYWRSARFAHEGEVRRIQSQPGRWTQEHIDVFRQMTRLEKLAPFGGRWSDSELAMLGAAPAPAHLRILPINSPPTTAEGIEALVRLPLTGVNFVAFGTGVGSMNDLSFLGRMSTLESIRLDLTHSPNAAVQYHAHTQLLVDTLANCTRLTELHLIALPITNDHLCRMLPSLSNLRRLTVDSWRSRITSQQLGGLSFASAVPHLAHTLERLHLSERVTATMPIEEVRHLYALTNLRYLILSIIVPASTPDEAVVRLQGLQVGPHVALRKAVFPQDAWPHMRSTTINCEKLRERR